MSGSSLGGSVGNGIGFDPNGQITRIDSSSSTSKNFTIPASDPTNPRWDLLCIIYKQTGDTLVPKPSDPITTINLNLHDDFQLVVREGTPSATPSYPAKQSGDIILAGLRVPANATLGTDVTVDLSIRELCQADIAKIPVFVQETPTGLINGTNVSFDLSKTPLSASSLLLMLDGVSLPASAWTLSGTTVTMTTAPAAGQDLLAYYIALDPSSTNPLAAFQETPTGTINGTNDTFSLTGVPADQNSTLVMVDGIILPISAWNLIQIGGSSAKIQFQAGYIPKTGQDIYCFYLVNPASLGVGEMGGVQAIANDPGGIGVYDSMAGNTAKLKSLIAGLNMTIVDNGDGTITFAASAGGGSLAEVHGDGATPIAIDPAVGITPTSVAEQIWWIAPNAGTGQILITASPAIAPGTTVGQKLTLMAKASANYLRIPNASGTDQDGDCDMGNNAGTLGQAITYVWDGTDWAEASRRV